MMIDCADLARDRRRGRRVGRSWRSASASASASTSARVMSWYVVLFLVIAMFIARPQAAVLAVHMPRSFAASNSMHKLRGESRVNTNNHQQHVLQMDTHTHLEHTMSLGPRFTSEWSDGSCSTHKSRSERWSCNYSKMSSDLRDNLFRDPTCPAYKCNCPQPCSNPLSTSPMSEPIKSQYNTWLNKIQTLTTSFKTLYEQTIENRQTNDKQHATKQAATIQQIEKDIDKAVPGARTALMSLLKSARDLWRSVIRPIFGKLPSNQLVAARAYMTWANHINSVADLDKLLGSGPYTVENMATKVVIGIQATDISILKNIKTQIIEQQNKHTLEYMKTMGLRFDAEVWVPGPDGKPFQDKTSVGQFGFAVNALASVTTEGDEKKAVFNMGTIGTCLKSKASTTNLLVTTFHGEDGARQGSPIYNGDFKAPVHVGYITYSEHHSADYDIVSLKDPWICDCANPALAGTAMTAAQFTANYMLALKSNGLRLSTYGARTQQRLYPGPPLSGLYASETFTRGWREAGGGANGAHESDVEMFLLHTSAAGTDEGDSGAPLLVGNEILGILKGGQWFDGAREPGKGKTRVNDDLWSPWEYVKQYIPPGFQPC